MSRYKKNYVGKIGYCDNRTLGLTDRSGNFLSGGHYVYIREISNDKCSVNIITSIEDRRGNYQVNKLNKVKNGYLYSIPKNDANFSRWSAINLDGKINKVSIDDIQNIGCKSMKKRHRWFVGKFTKK